MPLLLCKSHRLEDNVFGRLAFLPDPVPDGQHYKSFDELFGNQTTDKYRPSVVVLSAEAGSDKANRDVFKAVKARDIIKCDECSKPRCVFSYNKLTREQDAILLQTKEEHLFTCGETFSEESGLFVRESLTCATDIEIVYYSANLKHFVPPCCVYCGTEEELLDQDNDYIGNLYQQFSVVRPLCVTCRGNGQEAKTWGKKFNKKQTHA